MDLIGKQELLDVQKEISDEIHGIYGGSVEAHIEAEGLDLHGVRIFTSEDQLMQTIYNDGNKTPPEVAMFVGIQIGFRAGLKAARERDEAL